MNIELSIEKLILHDMPLAQRHQVAAAIEQELARLLAERGVPPDLAARGGSIPIDAARVEISAGLRPEAIGAQVAESIYGSLAGGQPQAQPSTRRQA
ncbi:MAG TPA: hypothetical protein VF897_16595 [Roseiflexaceae bacterium]